MSKAQREANEAKKWMFEWSGAAQESSNSTSNLSGWKGVTRTHRKDSGNYKATGWLNKEERAKLELRWGADDEFTRVPSQPITVGGLTKTPWWKADIKVRRSGTAGIEFTVPGPEGPYKLQWSTGDMAARARLDCQAWFKELLGGLPSPNKTQQQGIEKTMRAARTTGQKRKHTEPHETLNAWQYY